MQRPCPHAEVEPVGDRHDRHTNGHTIETFAFPGREAINHPASTIAIVQGTFHMVENINLVFECPVEDIGGKRLFETPDRPEPHRAYRDSYIAMCGHHDDRPPHRSFIELREHLKPVYSCHANRGPPFSMFDRAVSGVLHA